MSNLDVKKIRKMTGKSQSDFGKLLSVSRHAVVLWEKKETKPRLEHALRLKDIENKCLINSGLGVLKKNQKDGVLFDGSQLLVKKVFVISKKDLSVLRNFFYDKLYINNLEKESLILKQKEKELSLEEWFKIEVVSKSMDDSSVNFTGTKYSLQVGDWVYCRSIPKTLWRLKLPFYKSNIFCFFHNIKGIIFRTIKSHNLDTGELVLSSLNTDSNYPDIKINLAECSYVLNIVKVLSSY